MNEKQKTIELKLTGNEEMINKVLSLLSLVAYNGNIGHSGYFFISCDGDGWDRLKIEPEELYNAESTIGAWEIPPEFAGKIFERISQLEKLKEKE